MSGKKLGLGFLAMSGFLFPVLGFSGGPHCGAGYCFAFIDNQLTCAPCGWDREEIEASLLPKDRENDEGATDFVQTEEKYQEGASSLDVAP